jgi:hypothetical protein
MTFQTMLAISIALFVKILQIGVHMVRKLLTALVGLGLIFIFQALFVIVIKLLLNI